MKWLYSIFLLTVITNWSQIYMNNWSSVFSLANSNYVSVCYHTEKCGNAWQWFDYLWWNQNSDVRSLFIYFLGVWAQVSFLIINLLSQELYLKQKTKKNTHTIINWFLTKQIPLALQISQIFSYWPKCLHWHNYTLMQCICIPIAGQTALKTTCTVAHQWRSDTICAMQLICM